MESSRVKSLANKVPDIKHLIDINKLETGHGGKIRTYLVVASFIPLIMAADRGGVLRMGFTSKTMEEEFKAKPDYITEELFMVHRQDIPEFKHF
mmetsp:Transcript_26303/g.25482  ORF Transcript_26303/g.25482 Transcript_26303/m.25482 type:complete len:94 (+) Transcript_26303:20-301(+)